MCRSGTHFELPFVIHRNVHSTFRDGTRSVPATNKNSPGRRCILHFRPGLFAVTLASKRYPTSALQSLLPLRARGRRTFGLAIVIAAGTGAGGRVTALFAFELFH